jgi:2,4-dienoyl-CoA reductase-like NADH-dependent reductase (Old Yellow Enzyme family)
VIPTEMTIQDILRTVGDFQRAAKLAAEAGFDGIEIHAHAKSLISQFFNDSLNVRTDEYGAQDMRPTYGA